MTAPKPKQPPPARPKRTNGFLVCDRCQRAVPYQGYDTPDMETWPQHRCRFEVRGFDRFTIEDPFRPDLPKALP